MSQASEILAALQAGETLTPMDALNRFGCFRLGARIYELIRDGHDIENIDYTTPDGKRVACYRMRQRGLTPPTTPQCPASKRPAGELFPTSKKRFSNNF